MNFRSDVSSFTSRPIEAMVCINEIESAKSVADVKTSYSILSPRPNCRQTSRFLILKLPEDNRRKRQKKSLHSRKSWPIPWLIFEYFKVSDADKSVLELNEILTVELKNDNAQSSNTRWDETKPDEEILETEYCRLLQQSEQLKPLLSLCIQDTVQKR